MQPFNKTALVQRLAGLLTRVEAGIGHPVILAGGAVRDLIHDNEPKDYDLFILRDVSAASYPEIAEDALNVLRGIPGVSDLRVYTTYREGTDVRLAFVVKFMFEGLSVDLLQYAAQQATLNPRAQACHFDSNINMVWMNAQCQINVEPEARAVIYGDRPITQLCFAYYREGTSADRLAYMQSKYPHYAVDFETVITPEGY